MIVTSPTGESRDVSPGEAVALLRAGWSTSSRVPVYDMSGQLVTIDAADVPKMERAGMKPADPGELERHQRAETYGGPGGVLAAGALGAAKGLSFGLAPVVGRAIDPGLHAIASGYVEESPIAAGAGEVVGMVAPAILSGGSSIAARGASATLPGLATRAGLAAERAVAGVGGGLARRTLARAAGGAVEGGIAGGVTTVSDLLLKDQDLTAERVLAGVGWGAVAGGGIAGGLGLAVGGARAGARRLATAATGVESPGVVRAIESAVAKASAKVSGAPVKAIDDLVFGGGKGMFSAEASAARTAAAQAADMAPKVAKAIDEAPLFRVWQDADVAGSKVLENAGITTAKGVDAKALARHLSTVSDPADPVQTALREAAIESGDANLRRAVAETDQILVRGNQMRQLEAAKPIDPPGELSTVGAIVAGAPGAAVGKAATTVWRALADPAAAVRTLQIVDRVVAALPRRVTGAVARSMAGGGPKAMGTASVASTAAARAAVEAHRADPAGGAERMADRLRGVDERIAPAVIATAIRATEHLGRTMPPSASPHALTPHLDVADAPRWQQARWARRVEAIEDPLGVLDRLATGTLTREHVEALAEVYPRLYDEIRVEVLDRIAGLPKAPPYAAALQLGILLRIPSTRSLAPEALAAHQLSWAHEAEREPAPAPRGRGRPPKSIQHQISDMDRIAYDGE